MIFEQIIFYLFSAVLIAAAVGMVTVRNPVYAALCLILSFFTSAALWLLLECGIPWAWCWCWCTWGR